MEINKEVRIITKDNLSISYDFNSLYPISHIVLNSTCPKAQRAYPSEKYMNESFCSFFNSGSWIELNRCAFLTEKYHNPESLVF